MGIDLQACAPAKQGWAHLVACLALALRGGQVYIGRLLLLLKLLLGLLQLLQRVRTPARQINSFTTACQHNPRLKVHWQAHWAYIGF